MRPAGSSRGEAERNGVRAEKPAHQRGLWAALALGLLFVGVAGTVLGVEKEPSELFWTLLDKAQWGEVDAQYAVGVMYQRGRDVEKDDAEAAKWFGEAAAQGHAQATYQLAEMYEKGLGVAQDKDRAIGLYKKAAEQGVGAGDQDAYYAELMEVQKLQMQQDHELQMQREQQQYQAQMQKQQQRQQEKLMRRYYDGDIRHRRYNR